MGAGRPGRAQLRRRVQRHLPDRRRRRRCSTCARTRAPRVLFVEDDEQLDKALEVRARLPLLRKIVVFDMEGLRDFSDPSVMSLDALRELGREHLRAASAASSSSASPPAGPTTWRSWSTPRAPPASPRARCTATRASSTPCAATTRWSAQDEHDERMCFLPLCHIAERMGGEYFAMYTGSILNFVENPETVPENVREIAPTVFTAVPRVWEKFYSGVMIALQEASARCSRPPTPGRIGVGSRGRRARAGRASRSARLLKLQFTLARWLALDNVRKLIGIHRARFLRHRRGADLARAGHVVPGARRADARGLGHDRDLRRVHRHAGRRASSPASIGPARPYNEVQHRPGDRRDPGARPQRLHGLPEPAREDRRDHRRRRLAAHRRRRHGRRGRVLPHHRPHEGHHHHGRRQEHHAERAGERAEVLALHHRCGGDRRQARLPHGDRHDRPGERREVRAGPRRAVLATTRA